MGQVRHGSATTTHAVRRRLHLGVSPAPLFLFQHLLPGKSGDQGQNGTGNRLFVDAILWLARETSPWRD